MREKIIHIINRFRKLIIFYVPTKCRTYRHEQYNKCDSSWTTATCLTMPIWRSLAHSQVCTQQLRVQRGPKFTKGEKICYQTRSTTLPNFIALRQPAPKILLMKNLADKQYTRTAHRRCWVTNWSSIQNDWNVDNEVLNGMTNDSTLCLKKNVPLLLLW